LNVPRLRLPAHRARAAGRAALVALLVALVAPLALYAFPPLAGADHAFVVLSGSMEPALSTGDVVFARAVDPPRIAPGDVVTYRAPGGAGALLTHRVVEASADEGGVVLRTKGDANDAVDPWPVRGEDVVGVMAFRVPLWGHLPMFAKTWPGYVALVVLPSLALLAKGARDLWRELERRKEAQA
jgi:signal peptidase